MTKRGKSSLAFTRCGGIAAGLLLVLSYSASAAPSSFNQAVADYNNGKYRQAIDSLVQWRNMYPNNALVHYYLGLSYQASNQFELAKTEYQWVTQNGPGSLKANAQTALGQIGKLTAPHSGFAPSSPSLASASRPAANHPASASKVRKILEFYTDW